MHYVVLVGLPDGARSRNLVDFNHDIPFWFKPNAEVLLLEQKDRWDRDRDRERKVWSTPPVPVHALDPWPHKPNLLNSYYHETSTRPFQKLKWVCRTLIRSHLTPCLAGQVGGLGLSRVDSNIKTLWFAPWVFQSSSVFRFLKTHKTSRQNLTISGSSHYDLIWGTYLIQIPIWTTSTLIHENPLQFVPGFFVQDVAEPGTPLPDSDVWIFTA